MKNGKIIFLLFLLALGVRLIVAWNTYVMPNDGPRYIEAASYYTEGNLKAALKHDYHPFYPCLMAVFYRVLGNWEWAGMLVSILLGSLAVIPLYLIGQRVFNSTIATIAAVFYAFHPHAARLSVDIITTATFIFLLVSTLYLIMEALKNWTPQEKCSDTHRHSPTAQYRMFFFAGISSLLAYFTRPDGLILLFIGLCWITLKDFTGWWKGGLKKKILTLGLLCLPWIIGLAFYVGGLKYATGEWQFSQKLNRTSLSAISGLTKTPPVTETKPTEPTAPFPSENPMPPRQAEEAASDSASGGKESPQDKANGFVHRHARALYLVAEDFVKAANPWLLLLIIVGLLTGKRFSRGTCSDQPPKENGDASPGSDSPTRNRLDKWIIWSTVIIYLMALWRFALIYDRVSKRYTTPLITIIIFWGAVGLYIFAGWLYQRVKQPAEPPQKYPIKWLIIGVLITIISFAFFTFKPMRAHRIEERTVGEWLRQYHQAPAQPLIIGPSNQITYYSGSRVLDHHRGNRIEELGRGYNTALKNARFRQADYLVINHKTKNYIPDFADSIKSDDLELIYEIKSDTSDKWFKVYKLKK